MREVNMETKCDNPGPLPGVCVVGKVKFEEMSEIRDLHARKVALKELVVAMASMSQQEVGAMYDLVVSDLAATCMKFDTWWADKTGQNGWPKNTKLEIDFTTCEIFTRD